MGIFDDNFGVTPGFDLLVHRITNWKYDEEKKPLSIFDEIEWFVSHEDGSREFNLDDYINPALNRLPPSKYINHIPEGWYLMVEQPPEPRQLTIINYGNLYNTRLYFINSVQKTIVEFSIEQRRIHTHFGVKMAPQFQIKRAHVSEEYMQGLYMMWVETGSLKTSYEISKDLWEKVCDLQAIFYNKHNQHGHF